MRAVVVGKKSKAFANARAPHGTEFADSTLSLRGAPWRKTGGVGGKTAAIKVLFLDGGLLGAQGK